MGRATTRLHAAPYQMANAATISATIEAKSHLLVKKPFSEVNIFFIAKS